MIHKFYINKVLKSNGHLVFEVRDPAAKAWHDWNRENTYKRVDIPKIGYVEEWCDLIDVSDGWKFYRRVAMKRLAKPL